MRNIPITAKSVTKTALVVASLCVACCAVPIAAIVGTLSLITATGWLVYGAKVAVALLLVILAVGGFVLVKRRRAPACRIDGSCKSGSA